MKKTITVVTLLIIAAFLGSAMPEATAKSKKSKKVILSTVDIDENYEVLGLVYSRSSGDSGPKKIHAKLKKQARAKGADYVVGITYFNNAGYLYGSGTAVKLIKEDKPKK